jgi:AraC-like DNA-binding protein
MEAAVAHPRRFTDRVCFGGLRGASRGDDGSGVQRLVLSFVEAGSGWFSEGPERWEVGPGEVVVTAPGAARDLSGLAHADGWSVAIVPEVVGMRAARGGRLLADPGHPSWLSYMRPACLVGRFRLPDDVGRAWRFHGRRLAAESHGRAVGHNQALVAVTTLLLLDVARMTVPDLEGPALRGESFVASAFDVIERRFHEPISLDDVAADVAVSPAHLARLARRLSGRSVNEWIAERRMAEARRLLLETDAKVEEVAVRCGYADVGYFRRQFRRHHDMAPAQWRAAA